MVTKTDLDFSLLPSIDKIHAFPGIDDELKANLCPYTKTYNRAAGAIIFSKRISDSEDKSFNCNDKKFNLGECYLRAALGEYASMEETLKLDLNLLNITGDPFRANAFKTTQIQKDRAVYRANA
jgi:hypothetical protein